MPGLYLEELEVGRTFEHAIRRTVTEMDNTLFSCLTHNPQPLHIDHDFAAKSEWGKPLFNSMFTLALMIGISVNDTTIGTTVGNLGMTDVKFPKPVFHGDTIHVTTEVLTLARDQVAARRRHRRVPAQGLQPARRAGGGMPPPGHDAQATESLRPHALAPVHSRRRREEARQGRGHRRRRADPRSGGRGQRAAQGGRAPDRRALHRGDARQARKSCDLRAHQRARYQPVGRTMWPASPAHCPTASCCPRRARARTCTRCPSPSTTRRKKPAPKWDRRASSRSSPRRRSRCSSSTPTWRSSTRLDGVTWGAEDLSAVLGARTNREDDGRAWTSPYMLARDLCLFTAAAAEAQPIDTVFVNFRDAEGLRQECLAAMRDGFTGKMAIHPNQVAVMNEVFTPSADEIADVPGADPAIRRQPGCRRTVTSRADGRQSARRPRRAHPGACQDGGAEGLDCHPGACHRDPAIGKRRGKLMDAIPGTRPGMTRAWQEGR